MVNRDLIPYSHLNESQPEVRLRPLGTRSRKRAAAAQIEPSSKRFQSDDTFYEIPSSPPREFLPTARESDTEDDEPLQTNAAVGSMCSAVSMNAPVARRSFNSFGSHGGAYWGSISPANAEDTIRRAVDNGTNELYLNGQGLTEIPSEIGDLRDLVVLGRSTVKISLSNNDLTELNLRLFDANISHLLLRDNSLEFLPPQILRLQNLQELSVSHNRLEYLPFEILNLPKLEVLSQYPNRWEQLPEGVQNFVTELSRSFITRKISTTSRPPSLIELCQRELAQINRLREERKSWALTRPTQKLVDHAQRIGAKGLWCYVCHTPVMSDSLSCTEWWNLLGNRELPFRKLYCSLACLRDDIYDNE